jgi:trehalose-6-phosphate synthase
MRRRRRRERRARVQRVSEQLISDLKCFPVFLEPDLKQRFYKGFCKQQLWPLLHYVLPMSPYSPGRFSPDLWQAYVRANMVFTERLVSIVRQARTPPYLAAQAQRSLSAVFAGAMQKLAPVWQVPWHRRAPRPRTGASHRASAPPCRAHGALPRAVQDEDYVWMHDYHLMVLPSLLRRRLHRVAIGMFLHSAFPSSEIFRTTPKREELLRALLNADVLGFHTFDYARHFLSCCSRMLGLEHYTKRGRIMLNYYGRDVHLKILPTCARPPARLAVPTAGPAVRHVSRRERAH